MQEWSKKTLEKRRGKKAARSAERANAKRQRENARQRVTLLSLRLNSQSSTANDEPERNLIFVANPNDVNNTETPAPPDISLLTNANNIEATPPNDENNNEAPAFPNTSLLPQTVDEICHAAV